MKLPSDASRGEFVAVDSFVDVDPLGVLAVSGGVMTDDGVDTEEVIAVIHDPTRFPIDRLDDDEGSSTTVSAFSWTAKAAAVTSSAVDPSPESPTRELVVTPFSLEDSLLSAVEVIIMAFG